MPFDREYAVAVAAAREAGVFAAAEYQTFVPVPDAPASISTHVDHGCQEIILKRLRQEFPDDGLVGEENTPTLAGAAGTSGRTWVVDPIDGTRGFAMKNGEFSIMIGLTIGDRPVVGVVLEPTLGRLTAAAQGHGCWASVGDGEPVRCRVTAVGDPSAGVLVQSHSKPGKPPKPVVAAIRPARVLETYSAGIKLALVARGEADYYVNDYRGFHDWDICAGHVLVEEAGGTVSQFSGGPIQYGRADAAQRGHGRQQRRAPRRVDPAVEGGVTGGRRGPRRETLPVDRPFVFLAVPYSQRRFVMARVSRRLAVVFVLCAGLTLSVADAQVTKGKAKADDAPGVAEVYESKKGFRFRITGPDGKTIAAGFKDYKSKAECVDALDTIKAILTTTKIVDGKAK